MLLLAYTTPLVNGSTTFAWLDHNYTSETRPRCCLNNCLFLVVEASIAAVVPKRLSLVQCKFDMESEECGEVTGLVLS